jgi:hypothetical protein
MKLLDRVDQRSKEMTKQASNDASRVKNDGLRLFDELPVICTGPLVVAVPPLLPDVLEGGVP